MISKWVIQQRWDHVVFANWMVPIEWLLPWVPFEIDSFDGQAVVSWVPFQMSQIRFPYLPPVPGFSKLNEVNLRTYVRHRGEGGIFFFTLDSDHRLGNWIAQKFFQLPYRQTRVSFEVESSRIEVRNQRPKFSSFARLKIGAPISAPSPFDRWCTDRFFLLTEVRGRRFRGDVSHRPWCLHQADLDRSDSLEVNFTDGLHFESKKIGLPNSMVYSPGTDVSFRKFSRI